MKKKIMNKKQLEKKERNNQNVVILFFYKYVRCQRKVWEINRAMKRRMTREKYEEGKYSVFSCLLKRRK